MPRLARRPLSRPARPSLPTGQAARLRRRRPNATAGLFVASNGPPTESGKRRRRDSPRHRRPRDAQTARTWLRVAGIRAREHIRGSGEPSWDPATQLHQPPFSCFVLTASPPIVPLTRTPLATASSACWRVGRRFAPRRPTGWPSDRSRAEMAGCAKFPSPPRPCIVRSRSATSVPTQRPAVAAGPVGRLESMPIPPLVGAVIVATLGAGEVSPPIGPNRIPVGDAGLEPATSTV